MIPSAYTHIVFPAFQLPSGRWVRIDMAVQDLTPTVGQPYLTTPVVAEVNPWAEGGLPEIVAAAAPDAGLMGGDSCEFTFHNVPIRPSEDLVTLAEIIAAHRPEDRIWNIRYWVSGDSAPETFSTRPQFWGIIDSSEPTGDILRADEPTWSTYSLTARNAIMLGEKVTVEKWISTYLLHAIYDKIPTNGVWIDGIPLIGILHDDGGQPTWRPWVYLRYFLLIDILHTISQAIGITGPINGIGVGAGTIHSSWDFIWLDSPDPEPVETPEHIDKLCLACGIILDPDHLDDYSSIPPPFNGNEIYQHEYGLFDDRKLSPISFFNLGSVLEVLKRLLLPLGLVASVQVTALGERYMEVREVELDRTEEVEDLIEGMTVAEGEAAAYGFRVVTANNGELVDGESGDRSIDNIYMSATRLRLGDRWTHVRLGLQDHNTDDLNCLYSSPFIWDAENQLVRNVFKINVRRDGSPAVTARTHMPFPPAVYPNWNDMDWEKAMHEAGSVVAKACMAYYWNGNADPETDPVGIFRRYMKRLIWREARVDQLGSMPGWYKILNGVTWTVRKRTTIAAEHVTEYECERGTYDA